MASPATLGVDEMLAAVTGILSVACLSAAAVRCYAKVSGAGPGGGGGHR
jgi:hypothetical protein